MTSKSPIKDYSRLLGVDRTVKKEENVSRLRLFDSSDRIADELRIKMEVSLKHSTKLIDENAAMKSHTQPRTQVIADLLENKSYLHD